MLQKLALFVFVLLLAACSSAPSPVVPAATATLAAPQTPQPSAVPATAAAATPAPQPSPTAGQGRVVLVAPAELGAAVIDPLRAALTDLASGAKLGLESRAALAAGELKPEYKIIIYLQAPTDLPALLAAAPQAQFVVVGGADLEAKGNLSVIRQREEFRAFLAGYISVLAAPDWRSLGLLPDNAALQDAFINGGRYWCGRCIPSFAPQIAFPLAVAQPAGSPAANWQAGYGQQQKNIIQAVYISSQAYSPELVKFLFSQKLVLLGTQPPSAELTPLWAATLRFDALPALQKLWPAVSGGKGGQSADAALQWSDVNESLFSPGRQRLAAQTLAGLLDGTIGPFSIP